MASCTDLRRHDGAILGGVNSSAEVDGAGRPLTKAVDTGWASATGVKGLASSILTLWGMARALGTSETDVTRCR